MTVQSDKRLQEFIQSQMSIDYTDEDVQKRTVISTDHGASITLYDYIHSDDIPMSERHILNLDDMSANWIEEFRKMFAEEINK